MSFIQIYTQAFLVIISLMTILWVVSVIIKNVSIVDLFWGFGFVLTAGFYFLKTDGVYDCRFTWHGEILEKVKISDTNNSVKSMAKAGIGG
jgi:steroid 5-alpha reductase family enzyme